MANLLPSSPPRPAGTEPFFVVLNAGSGRDGAADKQAAIDRAWGRAGRRYEIRAVHDPAELATAARWAVEQAREHGGIVVAAGGDGTLNAVTQVVLGTGLPFAILPQGTFNYFGRTYGIPADTERAAAALLDARIQPVQVGMLNGRAFLVNASLGLYPQLLEDREAYKQRYGRSRTVALVSGLITLLRRPRQLHLELVRDGQTHHLRTPTLVVGNNALQLEQLGIEDAGILEQGGLVAMSPKPVGTLALYWMILLGALSRLGEADNVVSFGFQRLVVQPPRGHRNRYKVAMDGEVSRMQAPLAFSVSEHRLPLLVPRHIDPADRA
ncbi:diacylglycerol kinase [Pigmentiphaga sp. NML080357]|uniref:diacylglycerol/lipid kinase family protein n=1 Tax=Pigmentiphaga sp. NML080357 TaxID=2008675 RepID=UPI000B4193C4|nr:diacylglycerol kinase family protein [Pigmentiphaga sp. NML080357]OVZ64698.1 diacylglycerol kinase [Pigmentiphaga sp. NML080357]